MPTVVSQDKNPAPGEIIEPSRKELLDDKDVFPPRDHCCYQPQLRVTVTLPRTSDHC